MKFNLDGMSEEELVELNRQVIERVRLLRRARAGADMRQFAIGERVAFQPADGPMVIGVLTRRNQKSVTVIATDGRRWNVSPGLLRVVIDAGGAPQPERGL